MIRRSTSRAETQRPAYVAAVLAAAVAVLWAAAPTRAQNYSDEYACQHGNPASPRTAEACDRLGEPIPSEEDRRRERALRPPPPPPPRRIAPAQTTPSQLTPAPTANPAGDSSAEFQRGLADRQSYEIWFHALMGDYRAGAAYWASHDGVPGADCQTAGAAASFDWRAGCLADQAQLRGPDMLRQTSPSYRTGWDSYQEPAPTPYAQAPAVNAAPAQNFAAAAAPPAKTAAPAPPTGKARVAINGVFVALAIAGILAVLLGLALYFLPTFIAASRKKQNALTIFALNLLLGWTLVGWVVALIWSLSPDPQPVIGI
ncbi:MAG TPA: superinfection immunity protein [Caulobacteraceae bacterium]|nr:superinfection immunity protein [Caulobacteraceae bacterium]